MKKLVSRVLNGIDLNVKKGEFVTIVGEVGSGKSSLLRGLLGELRVIRGRFEVNGSVAYIPQEAFLMNDTLRNNILFGKPFEENKYNKILEISQLRPDLEMLAQGDMTEIGERGLNLSGGQKQRISIARALYSDNEIYLVDDCMSALDSHVGSAILEEVFFGYLKGKKIIMTTHRYHFLSRVNKVFVLKQGQLIAGGSYDNMKETLELKRLAVIEQEAKKQQFGQQGKSRRERNSALEKTWMNHFEETRAGENQNGLSDNQNQFRKPIFDSKAFKFYFKKGGWLLAVLIYSLFTTSTILSIFSDWFAGALIENSNFLHLPHLSLIIIYAAIILLGAVFYIAKFNLVAKLSCEASFGIFDEMVWNVLRRKMSFFNKTPSGVVLNRCIDDTEITDYEFALNIKDVSESAFAFVGALLLTLLGSLLMAPFLVLLIFLSAYFFLAISRKVLI